MRSSPKYSHEPINEFFYDLALDSGADEDAIGGDEMTTHALFRLKSGVDTDLVDEYNAKKDSFEDQINAQEIILLCIEACGAILHQTNDGFVTADVYTDEDELARIWQACVDDTTLEACDECDGEAESYGKGEPVVHAEGCAGLAEY